MDLSYWTAEQSHHNGAIDCGAVVPFPRVILIGRQSRTTSWLYYDWSIELYHSPMLFSLDTILRCH